MKKNVLLFPSGAENSLNLYDSLKYNLHFELFGATSKNDHSEYIFDDKHLAVGNYLISDLNFFSNFNSMLEKFNIDFIIPTHDEISSFLVANENKIRATVVCSPIEACEIALSKIKTFNLLGSKEYSPKIYKNNEEFEYPLFVKPDVGSGGKGARVILNKDDMSEVYLNGGYLISELLPGDELTVDCFTDRNGRLLFIGPRTRERITTGVSFRSRNIELTDEIKSIANDLNNTIRFRGLWFFQLKKDKNGRYKLLEICIRSAGTMALYRQLGINFALLSLFDFMNYDISLIFNNFNIELDRYYKCCYKTDLDYDNVYIDFDDTLIINNEVNTMLIRLIYQMSNRNKKIYLITKHETDIIADLRKYSICEDLFEEIILINDSSKKKDYIKKEKSIFIDNYYPERKEVSEELNIPVFDVDAIECLIDYSRL